MIDKDKKVVKLAIIRDEDTPCPFGLKIPFACRNAGDTIRKMAPIAVLGGEATEKEKKQLAKANRMVMMMDSPGHRCPYAGKIFKDKKAVECNFDSNAPGETPPNLLGSPFYSKVYDNIALDGLYSYPLGWYGDNNISRNLYYGAYSLQGSDKSEKIEKTAKFSTEDDIRDAVEHAVMQEGDTSVSGTYCYNMTGPIQTSLEEILNWDDYGSWGDFRLGELKDLSEEELVQELNSFRPGFATQALQWIKSGKFPPIILVDSKNAGTMIGDGRGRVNLAVGLDFNSFPVITLKEENNGNICFSFEEGRFFELKRTAGDVVDVSDRFKQKQEETEQEKILQQLQQSSPSEFDQKQQNDMEKARESKFLSQIQEKSQSWMHRFSDVRKDEEGFFIFKNDNEAGNKMLPGQFLSDYAMNNTPYWQIVSVDGDKIRLKPIGSNPLLTGVGAGGAKLTNFDINVFTGNAEKQKVETISKKLESGEANIDDVIYLLEGTAPLQMGPNGSQGGWYNADDTAANRGGRKGKDPKEIMMSDAKKLSDWGFQVPKSALSGDMNTREWGDWLSGNGSQDINHIPKNMDNWIDYHKKMTEKGKWRYDDESLEKLRRNFSKEKTQEYHEQVLNDFNNMDKEFFKKKYPQFRNLNTLSDLIDYFDREEKNVEKRLNSQDVYLTEGEEDTEESIIKNIFNKERRIAIRNTMKLINMARENSDYVKYLHDMMKMSGSDWYANEKVIDFFEEIDDEEGLKYALENLKDPTNRRYAYANLSRINPNLAADLVPEDESLEALRGLINGYINKNSPPHGEKMDQYVANKHMSWVQNIVNKHNILDKIKKDIDSKDFEKRLAAEDLLGAIRSAIKTYTYAMWLSPEKIEEFFPQFYDLIVKVREM